MDRGGLCYLSRGGDNVPPEQESEEHGVKSLQELQDIEAIRELRVKYSHFFDGLKIDELMGLLTEDVVFEFSKRQGGDWVGHETIRKNFRRHMVGKEPFEMMHATTNHLVELTGPDSARGRCYLIDLNLADRNPNPILLFGVYDDLYRKEGERWLIHRTRVDFLWPHRRILEPRAEAEE